MEELIATEESYIRDMYWVVEVSLKCTIYCSISTIIYTPYSLHIHTQIHTHTRNTCLQWIILLNCTPHT